MNPSKADKVLREIRTSGESMMIIGPGRGKMLADLVREHQPKRLLEISDSFICRFHTCIIQRFKVSQEKDGAVIFDKHRGLLLVKGLQGLQGL